jgi:MFS family permease
MVPVLLPSLARDLGISTANGAWLVTGFLLVTMVLQPLAGRIGDGVGHRRALLGGLWMFALASLGAEMAPAGGVLLACRALQAAAGAIITPNGIALLSERLPAARLAGPSGSAPPCCSWPRSSGQWRARRRRRRPDAWRSR